MADKEVSVLIKAIDQFTATAQQIEQKTQSLSKTFSNIRKVIAGAFVAYEVKQFFSESIRASIEQEQADMQLAQSIRQVGLNIETMLPYLRDLAIEFQNTTTRGDEEIQMMEALLLRFGVAPSKMRAVISAILDYATVTGKDLKTATFDVAKAIEGNLMMLQRYGVHIDKTTLQTRGLDAVIEALNKKFGGAESAVVNTYGGRLKQLSNVYGELKEQIGDVITKNEAVKDAMAKLSNVLIQIREDFKTSGTQANEFATQMGNLIGQVAEGLPYLIKLATTVGTWIAKAFQVAGIVIGNFVGAIATGDFKDFLKAVREEISALDNNIDNLKANMLDEIVVVGKADKALNSLAQSYDGVSKKMSKVNENLTDIKKVGQDIGEYIKNLDITVDTEKIQRELKAMQEFTKSIAFAFDNILRLTDRLSNAFVMMINGQRVAWREMLDDMLRDFEKWVAEIIIRMAVLGLINYITGGTLTMGEMLSISTGLPMSMSMVPHGPGSIVPSIGGNITVQVYNATPDTYVKVFQNMPMGARIKIKEALL